MSLDLDPTEQQLVAALDRLATAYVPDAGKPLGPAQRRDHRRWLALAVAASLIALVAGIWAVTGRDTDQSVVTVPATPDPTAPLTPPATTGLAQRALPSSIGVIAPDIARRLGLGPTPWLQGEPEVFVDDASPATYAIRRGPAAEVVTWQLLPTYWWQTSRVRGTAVSLESGRTAFRSDDGATVSVSVLLDAGVLTASVGAADEAAVRAWLSDIDPADDATALEPPTGFEVVGRTVAYTAVAYGANPGDDGETPPGMLGGAFVITVELDRDASLADMVTARYRTAAFAPVSDDPSIVFDPDLQVLAWQAGPRIFVEVPATTGETVGTIASGLDTVASGSPDLVPGVRGFTGLGRIPTASLTRTVLAATPYGRFAYSELDDGTLTCWRISTFVGGTSGCDGSMSQRPICITSRGTEGPWDAMVVVIDRDAAEIVVEHQGNIEVPQIATGATTDGTAWVVGWVTGIDGSDVAFPATITVDGTACDL